MNTELIEEGYQAVANKDYELALSCYKNVLAKEPHNLDAIINIGYILFMQGNYVEAESFYNASLQKIIIHDVESEDIGEIHINQGHIYIKLNRLDKAQDEFDIAKKFTSNMTKIHLGYGDIHCECKNYSKAIEEYRKSIEYDPKFLDGYLRIVRALRLIGNYSEASDLLNTAKSLEPLEAFIELEFGHLASDVKQYGEAMNHYQAAAKLSPNELTVTYSIANLLLEQEDYSSAYKEYLKVKNEQPANTDAIYGLALASAGLGFQQEAIELIQSVLVLDPYNEKAHQALTSLLFKSGKWLKAIQTAWQSCKFLLEKQAR